MSIGDDMNALCRLEAQLRALQNQRDELRSRVRQHALEVLDRDGAAPRWQADLGVVTLVVPKPRAVVVDEDAFISHVRDAYGDGAIEHVVRVKENVREAVLESVKIDDDHPGVIIETPPPTLRVLASKEAKAVAALEMEQESVA